MNIIKLTKDGFRDQVWNSNIKQTESVKLENPLSYYLQRRVEIDGDATVEDFINTLMNHEKDVDFIFEGFTRGFKLKPFWDVMIKSPKKVSDLSFVEFYWHCDYSVYEGVADIFKDVSWHGVDDKVKVQTWEKAKYWALDVQPLNEWKNLPIRINKNVKFTNAIHPDIWEEDKKIEFVDLMEGETEMTLYEFIGGFLSELTFHGYPEDAEEFIKMLDAQSKSIKEGKEKMIPFEKIQLEWKEESLEAALKDEDYEKIPKLKKEIAHLKKKLKDIKKDQK